MTDLTEQWKKGELPYGRYYVELAYNGNNIIMADYWWDKALTLDDHEYSKEEVKRILAPVPSYEEYLESESHCAVYSEVNKSLKEENQQLKELLRECVEVLNDAQRNYGYDDSIIDICSPIITKIDEVLK